MINIQILYAIIFAFFSGMYMNVFTNKIWKFLFPVYLIAALFLFFKLFFIYCCGAAFLTTFFIVSYIHLPMHENPDISFQIKINTILTTLFFFPITAYTLLYFMYRKVK